jgi:hypothetical protein
LSLLRDVGEQRTPPTMRVLVAFEDVRSAYSRAIARAIRELRPGLDVRSIVLEELERELVRFDPHVVVCSRPNGTHPSTRGAWVQIPLMMAWKTTRGSLGSAWTGSTGGLMVHRFRSC